MHILCLTCYVHLRAEICLCGIQAIATRWAAHSTLCIDVHRTSRLGLDHGAVVASDAVLGVCTTMAAIDGII